jgi:histone acetyltransferase MYST1
MENNGIVVEIGSKHLVTWKNGHAYEAEIIEKRPYKSSRVDDKSASSSSSSAPTGIGLNRLYSYEYYIHYIDFDRRMDEWITIDRIQVTSSMNSSSILSLNSNKAALSKVNNLRNRKHEYMNAHTKHASDSASNTTNDAQLLILEKEHEEMTKIKNINSIIMSKYEIDTWYFSPYPASFCETGTLYVCEYCLKYMKKKPSLDIHKKNCTMHSPPGRQIYAEDDLSMFEIDGKDGKLYCQNLCLLSKLFLDHKTLYYDVEPFLFYVLCEKDEDNNHHIVGYFSKEKQSAENYNLACILTFPPYQRKGYGKFLISLSFEITKREGTTGSPEKPLSDLGKISYRSYWTFIILNLLEQYTSQGFPKNITLVDMSMATGIKHDDILSTLLSLNVIKQWKGQHAIVFSPKTIEMHLSHTKPMRLCKAECLTWVKGKK